MVRACLMALLIGVFCFPAVGQTPPPDTPPQSPGGVQGQRQDRREIARLYLVQRMRESLALTDAQTLKAMEVLKAIDQERANHRAEMLSVLSRIQSHLENDKTPENVYAKDVADFQSLQMNFEKRLRELELRLLGTMTPQQQARFLVLRRDLMNQMRGGGDPRGRFQGRRPLGRMGR